MLKKILPENKNFALYIVTFILAFISVIYAKFPNDKLNYRISSEIMANSIFNKVKIEKVKLRPFLSIELSGIELRNYDGQILVIEKAVLKPSLISLLRSNIKMPFKMDLMDGKMFGDINYSQKTNKIHSVSLKMEHIDFNELGSMYSSSISDKASIKGYLYGSLYMKGNNEGNFKFDIDDLDLSDIYVGKIKLPDFLDLRSTLKGRLVEKGTLVDELSFVNNDIELRINGSLPPIWMLSHGKMDLYYRLQVKGNKYSYIKSFLKKDDNGNHAGKIRGTLGNPDFVVGTDSVRNHRRNSDSRMESSYIYKSGEKLSL